MAIFYNQATLSYHNAKVASNVVSGEIMEALSVTKTAVEDCYRTGEAVTYVINVINAGTVPYNEMTLTDDLGAYAYAGQMLAPLDYVEGSILVFADGVQQAAPEVTAVSPLTIAGLSIPAGYNVTIVYQATANDYAPACAGSTIKNTVTLSGGQLAEAISASAVVPVCSEAELTLNKAISPACVTENGQLTYTFTLENHGLTPASGDVVLSDLFDPILCDMAVACDGCAWSEGSQYTYDQVSGQFNTLAGQITIPAASALQDETSGLWSVTPGCVTITVCGTI